ncbi:hypothetical protein Zmor_020622 [Zophobas morio]|uniref:Chemosensory protein n=1 Tax=Zophobas morio TaxID=2755281 RepID=A0AA38I665_9CUCU|nr:hypothetical protein Zmor_020622 [Zophobas morio]
MKVLALLFLTFVLVKCVPAPSQYTTKYDNIDLNQILKSDRLLRNYINCLLEKGKCSPDGEELKSHIEDALLTSCQKCSEKQRNGSKTIVRFLLKNKRDWWNELEAKYDPSGSYKTKYAEELKAEGIEI